MPKHLKIFINRRPFEARSPMTGAEILALAGYGTDYDLFKLKGEGDPTGGMQVPPESEVVIRNGLHFRAIPGNATFGCGR